ncbi:ADP-ribose pyrophosphatase YjhB, NUDIX family [Pilibacter termitis]|uniref:ADP-ribose pyrophosphatase YjhB, NUDIX family n=1 Tax=Pilibacter termitis TaxID=263852 RepID=A0A1T4MZ29_9ENTE|nr:NUDIX hydrolase [Pilibacter termitis]SJZ72161.1 ADP-ribose pyrophosphatase YjhB, NUDIX family [Pilibacter termitis]
MEKNKDYYEKIASQEEFLEWYHTQDEPKYEKPSVTVDIVIFTPEKSKILLIQRAANPFRDFWALPGGFVNKLEPSEMAVLRETKEETGVEVTQENIAQFYTFTTPNRDPRGWVISIAYFAVLPDIPTPIADDDAKAAKWFSIKEENGELLIGENMRLSLHDGENKGTNKMAFDHANVITMAWKKMRENQQF